nr:hypothetical protein [Tanacetum cinerariifolium]
MPKDVYGPIILMITVKEKHEKDKIGTKPDTKGEAWKSPEMSKFSHSQESRKREGNTNLKDQRWKTLKDVLNPRNVQVLNLQICQRTTTRAVSIKLSKK